MKPHKHAKLIKAWADGGVVQVMDRDGIWREFVGAPDWELKTKYRIKPEPKPDFKAAYLVTMDNLEWLNPMFELHQNDTLGNLMLTFDGETGKLKAAEVLK